MSGFENFIYTLGTYTFAFGVPALTFWLVDRIERPRRNRK